MRSTTIAFFAAIIAAIATVLAGYVQVVETPGMRIQFAADNRGLELTKIEELRKELENTLEKRLADTSGKLAAAAVTQKFDEVEKKIAEVEESTLGLRQAINPAKPEEILTIARLTDEIKSIKAGLKELDSKLTTQQKSFQDSIIRELKSSSNATTLILVVLIPLVLNFLYTVWKDFRAQKTEETEP